MVASATRGSDCYCLGTRIIIDIALGSLPARVMVWTLIVSQPWGSLVGGILLRLRLMSLLCSGLLSAAHHDNESISYRAFVYSQF